MSAPDPRDDDEARYQALVALHALSPDFEAERERLPDPYRGRDIGADLRLVAEATERQIPVSARLSVLYDLAKAGYPGRDAEEGGDGEAYRGLAASAVRFRVRREEDEGVAGDDLLEEIAEAAAAGVPLSTMPRAARDFVHHEVAFIGRRACTIERVVVDGTPATWIYSEFETDAPFAAVAGFLDPRRWPALAPMFFKRMDLIGAADPLALAAPPDGQPHWHGVFHEEVQLVRRVNTLLRCTYWRDGGGTAATTYDLSESVDGEIDVDRGYLLVTENGGVCRVQALKIVGFTEDIWDTVALLVCPFWTEFIRGAVTQATSTATVPPTQVPPGGPSPVGHTVQDWIEYFGEAVQPYVALCTDTTSRLQSRSYTSADAVADGSRWWSQFAKDWARAWTNWTESVEEVAERGLDGGVTPPGTPPERGRGTLTALTAPAAPRPGDTVIPLTDLPPSERLVCSELFSIGRGSARIPPDDVALTVEQGRDGVPRVRLRNLGRSAEHGLYVGRLETPAKQLVAPVQLYVSRATRA